MSEKLQEADAFDKESVNREIRQCLAGIDKKIFAVYFIGSGDGSGGKFKVNNVGEVNSSCSTYFRNLPFSINAASPGIQKELQKGNLSVREFYGNSFRYLLGKEQIDGLDFSYTTEGTDKEVGSRINISISGTTDKIKKLVRDNNALNFRVVFTNLRREGENSWKWFATADLLEMKIVNRADTPLPNKEEYERNRSSKGLRNETIGAKIPKEPVAEPLFKETSSGKIVISAPAQDSPLANLELKKGDVITHLNDKPVNELTITELEQIHGKTTVRYIKEGKQREGTIDIR